MGPSAGSSSSPTFCSTTGLPNWTAFSSVRRKSGCCRSMTFRFCMVCVCMYIHWDCICGPIYDGWPNLKLDGPIMDSFKVPSQYKYAQLPHLLFLHVLDPLNGLSLWIYHQRPPECAINVMYIRMQTYTSESMYRLGVLELQSYLLLLVTMTPFSVEKASEGSPWMFQSLTSVGLERNITKE